MVAQLRCGLDAALREYHRALLPERSPPHLAAYVEQSLVARGAAKALAMHLGARQYRAALAAVRVRTAAVLRDIDETRAHEALSLECCADLASRQRLVHATKFSNQLHSAHAATALLLAIMDRLLSPLDRGSEGGGSGGGESGGGEGGGEGGKDCGAAPLFVAGDEARGVSTMVVPAEFRALSNLHAEVAAAARELDGEMRRAIASEGWPPPQSARRTRVSFVGSLRCWKCARLFSKQWAYRGVCWECEGALRAAGACPFDQAEGRARAGGRAAAHAFCRHQQRCAVCDGGFTPCRECRLAQGDGEAVATLCAELQEELRPQGGVRPTLFVDFDRTLCTTKSGGSPLQGRHALDSELAALAAQLETYVVTRNSHEADIKSFLAARGVLVAGVCVVPRRTSKAAVMLALRPDLADGEGLRAIFVDDDVTECCDPTVAALPGLLRVIFRRGAA